MKKKITMVLAGLGLCASMMMFTPKEAEATKLPKGCENTCEFNGNDCSGTTMGCFCGDDCA